MGNAVDQTWQSFDLICNLFSSLFYINVIDGNSYEGTKLSSVFINGHQNSLQTSCSMVEAQDPRLDTSKENRKYAAALMLRVPPHQSPSYNTWPCSLALKPGLIRFFFHLEQCFPLTDSSKRTEDIEQFQHTTMQCNRII